MHTHKHTLEWKHKESLGLAGGLMLHTARIHMVMVMCFTTTISLFPTFMKELWQSHDWIHACVDPFQRKLFCNFTAYIGHTAALFKQGSQIRELRRFWFSVSLLPQTQKPKSKADNIYREQSCICGGHMVRDLAGDRPHLMKCIPISSGLRGEGVGG